MTPLAALALAITVTLTPTPHTVYLPIVAANMPPHVTTVTVTGRIAAMPADWRFVTVWLAPYTPISEDGRWGFYVLDPSVHPAAPMLPGGLFVLDNVPPGRYVVLAGPTPEEMLPVRNQYGWPAVHDFYAGTVDVGEVALWR